MTFIINAFWFAVAADGLDFSVATNSMYLALLEDI